MRRNATAAQWDTGAPPVNGDAFAGPGALLRYAERLEFGVAAGHSLSDLGQIATAADRLGSVEGISAGAITAGMDRRQRARIEMRHDDETAHLALFEGAQERLIVLE